MSEARSPSEDQRRALVARRDELSAYLAGSDPEAIVRAVSVLRVNLASEATDADTRKLLKQGFVAVLSPYPQWAVEMACLRFLNGSEGDGKFAPKAAEVARVCRQLVQQHVAEAQKIDAILGARIEKLPTEEERAACVEKVNELLAELKAASRMPDARERPATDRTEALARLERMRLDQEARDRLKAERTERGEAA